MGMTPAQAAVELGISRQAIHKAITDGRLKVRMLAPGWYLIDERSVAAYKPKDYPKGKKANGRNERATKPGRLGEGKG